MVKIEEIEDEHYEEDQPGPAEDEYYTDTESEITDDEEDFFRETIVERVAALKDIIPPQHRVTVTETVKTTYSWLSSGLVFGAKAAWVLSTGALLIGMPFALAFAEEQQYIEMEKEVKMQQSANELLTPGASSTGEARPAL